MCQRPRPDRAARIARFLTERDFRDQVARTCAILENFPGATFEEVMRAEAIALTIVKARAADSRPDIEGHGTTTPTREASQRPPHGHGRASGRPTPPPLVGSPLRVPSLRVGEGQSFPSYKL